MYPPNLAKNQRNEILVEFKIREIAFITKAMLVLRLYTVTPALHLLSLANHVKVTLTLNLDPTPEGSAATCLSLLRELMTSRE
jgi:hypothetical protein